MATSGKGLGIAFLINLCILLIIAVLFSIWRFGKRTRKFYQPKRVQPPPGRSRPPPLKRTFGLWVPQILRMSEDEMLRCAGVDAVMYIKVLRMGWELMFMVGFLVLAIILPINITSGNVDDLMGAAYDPDSVSEYMYWISPPAPPAPGASPSPSPDSAQPSTIEAPEIYNTSIGKAPPGLTWWQYLPGVPPLPDPVTELGPEYARYGWRYDDTYTVQEYYFTDLDKTTMTNVPEKSVRLWAHCVMTWVVTILAMWHLWRYCHIALRLRMLHLLTAPPGVETHTVLCTDVPGIPYGTIPNRLDGTVLKLVPASVKEKAFDEVNRLKATPSSIMLGKDAASSGRGSVVGAPAGSQDFTDVELGEKTPLAEGASTASTSPAGATVGSSGASSPAIDGTKGQQVQQQYDASWRMPDRWGEACDEINTGKSAATMVDGTFRKVYHNDVSHVHMVYDTSVLDPLVAKYLAIKNKAANAVDAAVSRFRRGKKMKPQKSLVIGPRFGEWGTTKYGKRPKKVDSFQHYADYLDHLHGAVIAEQATAKRHARPSAFVTFKERKPQVVASGSLMCEDLTTWRCQAAPRPDEIIWPNLGLRGWERTGRVAMMWICFFLLCMFFMIPVTAVQAILTTNSLVSFIQTIPIVNSVITGILPALALNIFLAILPMILRAMQKTAGRVSESQVDLGVVTWFFIFQVITVFFGSFVAGTFANQFEQLLDDPGSIVEILGTAAPQAGIFFVTFLLVRGMLAVPVSLLRVVPFIIYYIRAKLAATARAKQRLLSSPPMQYGTQIPGDTIAILLGLTFCCICPLITPAAFIYFSTAYIANKHNLAYVNSESYQAGGVLWLRVFDQCVTGLIIFQAVMICLLGIKEVVAPPLVVLPLPFITLAYAYAAHATFWPPMRTLSMMTAGDRDTREALMGKDLAEGVAEAYVSPSFSIDEAEHDELVRQCLLVQKAQESENYTTLEALYDSQDAGVVDDSDLDDEIARTQDKGLNGATATRPAVSAVAIDKATSKKASQV